MGKMTDAQIHDLLDSDDEKGLSCLAEEYGGMIRHLLGEYLKDAEDCSECYNDILLILWEKRREIQSFKAYICRVTRNVALNKRKQKGLYENHINRSVSDDEWLEFASIEESAESEAELRILTETFHCWLEKQSPENRFIFTKHFYFAEPVENIAYELGMLPSTVYTRIKRMKKSMKKELEIDD